MEGAELTGIVTCFFLIQLRKDRTPPPPPSRKVSSRELTAGTPELDRLLMAHLQVCKALLQVVKECGGGEGGSLLGSHVAGWGLATLFEKN